MHPSPTAADRTTPEPPPLLLAAALLFWGWHSGLWWLALPLALLAELPRATRWRFELAARERQRVADLCTLLIVVAGAWLFLRQPRLGEALILLIQWLPALVFPLLAVQVFSGGGGTELSVLFLSLRGDGKPAGAETVDLRWPYVLLCAISASMVSPQTPWFYPSLVALAAFGLWPLLAAPGRLGSGRRLAVFAVAAMLGWGLAGGLRWAHAEAEFLIMRLVEQWMGPPQDPYRATTAIGDIGRLKGSEHIRLRIYPAAALPGEAVAAPPALLRTASYDRYVNGTWFTSATRFEPVPQAGRDGWRPLIDPAAGADVRRRPAAAETRILLTLDRPEGLLPLPPDATAVRGPARTDLRQSVLSAVRFDVRGGPALAGYRVREAGRLHRAPPAAADRRVPPRAQDAVAGIIAEAGLDEVPADAAPARLKALFARRFRYSLTLPEVPPDVSPIAWFLTDARYGHCEYFATAAALVLRGAGIPTRYARGWSVQEYSPLERAWIARDRHAHAWVEVWYGGAWHSFDPTPPDWEALEAAGRPWTATLGDLAARLRFLLSGAGDEERGNRTWLLPPLALLVAVLAWRIARRGRRRRSAQPTAASHESAARTPFTTIEQALTRRGHGPRPGETLRDWACRLCDAGEPLGPTLAAAVAIHYRDRFDPAGIGAGERRRLAALLAECEAALATARR